MISVLILLASSLKYNVTGVKVRFDNFSHHIDTSLFSIEYYYIDDFTSVDTIVKNTNRCDIIIANCVRSFVLGKKLSKTTKSKIIMAYDDLDNTISAGDYLNYLEADYILFSSKYMMDNIKFKNKKCGYVFNGVQEPFYDRCLYKESISNGAFISRNSMIKNADSLLFGLPDYINLSIFGNVKCNMVPKNVRHYGVISNTIILERLKNIDMVIVPSRSEPFGIVCLEALSSGCLLLASFVDGMNDYLSDDTAINCGCTRESIRSAIDKARLLSIDERYRYMHNGFKLVEKFSWGTMTKKLEGILLEVFNGD